jgi:FkbM family methyltransferase
MDSIRQLAAHVLKLVGFSLDRQIIRTIGQSIENDIAMFTRLSDVATVFDIGANTGQSVSKFVHLFPTATFHVFEPDERAFSDLAKKYAKFDNVHLNNVALGESSKTVSMNHTDDSVGSSLLDLGLDSWNTVDYKSSVAVTTLDAYCQLNSVAQIALLKIDTQGYELFVLRGATDLLKSGHIKVIQLEYNFGSQYVGVPPFSQVLDVLTEHGYRIVSFYDLEYQSNCLSWMDIMFAHESLIIQRQASTHDYMAYWEVVNVIRRLK